MSFIEKTCEPCRGGVPPLNLSECQALLEHTPNWTLCENSSKLERIFTFQNFIDALSFVNSVAEVAEAENHHPDISFGWGYCKIVLFTHKIDGLHKNDFIMAAKINQITALNPS